MNKGFILILFFGVLVCFSQQKNKDPLQIIGDFKSAEQLFQKAENYTSDPAYAEEEEEKLYKLALAAYEKLLPSLKNDDSLQFHALSRTGLIYYYLDSLGKSKFYYKSAIELKPDLPRLEDSFLFKPLLYCGGIFYIQNSFDSAFLFYKQAEEIQDKYSTPLEESQRLYNRIGVMYYEVGNFRLAKNYFEKAIAVLNKTTPGDIALLVNYKINIASLLIKLEEYDEARSIYKSILPYQQYTNEIYHNLGIIDLRQNKLAESLINLQRVNYGESKRNIDLYYNFAMAYDKTNPDSFQVYLARAIDENQKWNGPGKNIQYGLILKLQGARLVRQDSFTNALSKYQQAIIQFQTNFNNPDINSNPEEFTGIFSFLNLFNTLSEKAETFYSLYKQTKGIERLKAALNAYRSAFKLATYVERTYESDEARLFLNQLKYSIHSRPIDISLELYDLTRDKNYLEEAYHFDQQNKASILTLNMQKLQVKKTLSSESELFDKEMQVKNAITRLSLRSSQISDSLELYRTNQQLQEYEIQLSRIQEKLNTDPQYREKHFSQYIPSVKSLFKLLDKRTAILSYHLSEEELLILVLTNAGLNYHKAAIDSNFFQLIDSFKAGLHEAKDLIFYSSSIAQKLYNILITPLHAKLTSVDRLIIIPDDELHYLPFEALQNEKNYLIENYAIQYQYSTSLLTAVKTRKLQNQIAFAPFTVRSFSDINGNKFNALPASADEIKDISGEVFTDTLATKKNFLVKAKNHGIIHLATHASVNNDEPMRSYIAFSPSQDDFKLYAEEIYTMDLDSTDLVILSACETGTGQLIKGEGLMSLSRAFAYAGCSNIITSLWKAEDKTTAYIAKRLHDYMQKGFSKDRSLQKAKLDLLHDNKLDPRYKLPNYWAHLIFIGDYEQQQKTSRWIWITGGLVTLLILYILGKRRNKPIISSS